MNKKYFIISFGFMLVMFVIGWQSAMRVNDRAAISGVAQAVPVIRFERFDESRNAMIIALFNPGALPMEIDRTELMYQSSNTHPGFTINEQEYGDKPLVLDPGDTILVPLLKNNAIESRSETGSFWGELEFRVPGREDFYSLHHRFKHLPIQ